mgnify:CR=1 FL=1
MRVRVRVEVKVRLRVRARLGLRVGVRTCVSRGWRGTEVDEVTKRRLVLRVGAVRRWRAW